MIDLRNFQDKSTIQLTQVLESYYDTAFRAGLMIIIKLARQILRENPDLDEFVMAMGSWTFWTHDKESTNDNDDRFHSLLTFLDEWDDFFRFTGYPIRFTADGEIVHMW
jgi:hypothetical protein